MSDDETILEIKKLIEEFTDSQSDIQGQILIAFPAGLPIVNTWRGEIDPILIGAVSAAVKLTFQNLCKNLKKGNMKRLILNNEAGRIIIQNVGPNAILTTIIDKESDVFRIAFGTSNLAIKIENLIKSIKQNLENLITAMYA